MMDQCLFIVNGGFGVGVEDVFVGKVRQVYLCVGGD